MKVFGPPSHEFSRNGRAFAYTYFIAVEGDKSMKKQFLDSIFKPSLYFFPHTAGIKKSRPSSLFRKKEGTLWLRGM
jgi:hypothetical protein